MMSNKKGMEVLQEILLVTILVLIGFVGIYFILFSEGGVASAAGQGFNQALQKIGLHIGAVGVKGIGIGSGLTAVITSDFVAVCGSNNKVTFSCKDSKHREGDEITCEWSRLVDKDEDSEKLSGTTVSYAFDADADMITSKTIVLNVVAESGAVASAQKVIKVYPPLNCVTSIGYEYSLASGGTVGATLTKDKILPLPQKLYVLVPKQLGAEQSISIPLRLKIQDALFRVGPAAYCGNNICEDGEKTKMPVCSQDCTSETVELAPEVKDFTMCVGDETNCVFGPEILDGVATIASAEIDRALRDKYQELIDADGCQETIDGKPYCTIYLWFTGAGQGHFKVESVIVPWEFTV